jgi:hypothetical protein
MWHLPKEPDRNLAMWVVGLDALWVSYAPTVDGTLGVGARVSHEKDKTKTT